MKKPRCLALVAGLLLSGCAGQAIEPIPQEGSVTRRITWVIAGDPAEQCAKVSRPLLMVGKALGCADWKDPNNCVIYLRAPRNADDRRGIETLGHEVLHCFAGRFHGPGPTD